MAEIGFKIAYYQHRPWWRRRYDVKMTARGFMTPPTAWVGSFWTANSARRFVDRIAKRHDFKTIDVGVMQHDES